MSEKKPTEKPRNGKLRIELSLDDALRAALETKPPPKDTKKANGPVEASNREAG